MGRFISEETFGQESICAGADKDLNCENLPGLHKGRGTGKVSGDKTPSGVSKVI